MSTRSLAGTTRTPEPAAGPHQIVLFHPQQARHKIGMSCICLGSRGNGSGRYLIEARPRFPAAEAVAAWRDWHEREGIQL